MNTIPESSTPVRSLRVLALTGAGISAESGILTFRGKDGYWRNLDPTKLATAVAFDRDPDTVWQWYRERRARVHGARPNRAHEALVRLAAQSRDFLLVTQNVDDLHARAEWAGRRLPADRIVQVHGDLFVTACSRCHFTRRETDKDAQGVPRCPVCAGPLRPGVVWFDEELERGMSNASRGTSRSRAMSCWWSGPPRRSTTS